MLRLRDWELYGSGEGVEGKVFAYWGARFSEGWASSQEEFEMFEACRSGLGVVAVCWPGLE